MERKTQQMGSCQVASLSPWSIFQMWQTEGGYRSHVRTPQVVFSLLVAFVKFFSSDWRKDDVLWVQTYSMPGGGIILILLLLGWGDGKSSERVCLGSPGLQTASWGVSLPTASTRNLKHLHLKLSLLTSPLNTPVDSIISYSEFFKTEAMAGAMFCFRLLIFK